jgi:hypothetical protein
MVPTFTASQYCDVEAHHPQDAPAESLGLHRLRIAAGDRRGVVHRALSPEKRNSDKET